MDRTVGDDLDRGAAKRCNRAREPGDEVLHGIAEAVRVGVLVETGALECRRVAILDAQGVSVDDEKGGGCDERGCDDPKPKSKPIGWCGTGSGSFSGSACNIFATVEEDECHDGALGNKWLRLDNGDLLWPQSINMTVPTLQHGQRVQIGFTTLQANPTFTSQCQYFAKPEEPDLAIELTCLTVEAPATTETK